MVYLSSKMGERDNNDWKLMMMGSRSFIIALTAG
jgi:hypothetical protein